VKAVVDAKVRAAALRASVDHSSLHPFWRRAAGAQHVPVDVGSNVVLQSVPRTYQLVALFGPLHFLIDRRCIVTVHRSAVWRSAGLGKPQS